MKENDKNKKNKLQIRNSTAEFLIFTSQANENTIEVRVDRFVTMYLDYAESQAERHIPMTMEFGDLDNP